MKIHSLFVLKRLIPEVSGLSKSEIAALVESARQSSIPRIRKYSGYCFVVSFFIPPIALSIVFIKLGLIPGEMSFVFVGAIGVLSVFSNYLLTSVFNTLILKPAIYDQLNKKSRPSQLSV
ncbi:hypothetical protein [Burkholderia sp. MSMB2157WGS]|uniref:hypothetical protein n=1 Tax=Burkholderia sp. MSMB2157WGS TaxID=1637928 RepID=UPI0012E32EF6|nr:hypothetical protein [Burkholderia sp. MSMB2157WGS]